MRRDVCQSCGAISAPPVPNFDMDTASVDAAGSLLVGGIIVHDWAGDPELDWPDDRPSWRFYGVTAWSDESYDTAEDAARAAWFDAMDPVVREDPT